ncbi:MAG: bifunctional hydroxymethylpyrimidine kinase/phosphomethylpyrimidine kinase [Bacteroidales bacterium]|nr:bifunctional hydroxymethylpyrimidine kinase/phosphomethylpyrimidine kinase [Bacteroidales bacterium]
MTFPVGLTIAGSDSGGCAGVQADIKTFSALGVFATSAISALTAQNTMGVSAIMSVDSEFLRQQIKAVLEDFNVRAIKIGMLYSKDNVLSVYDVLKDYKNTIPIVLDPVMISTSGSNLTLDEAILAIKTHLFPLATIITPNLNETMQLLNKKVETLEDMSLAAKEFIDIYNVEAVLIKGGHLQGEEMIDIFLSKEDKGNIRKFSSKRVNTINTHGTGCTLSSAIAAFLAKKEDLKDSVEKAKQYITNALEESKDITLGRGPGAVNHFFSPEKLIKI